MKIHIEEYNPKWKILFEQERELLLKFIINQSSIIEHIGSTAVIGLAAKPIIDIMIGVNNFSDADKYISHLEQMGYVYITEYEDLFPFRKFFKKEKSGNRTHHIHLVEFGSEFWIRHIKFRDHLRKNNLDRDNYHNLKLKLSKQDWEERNDYNVAKSEFIKNIEMKIL